MASELAKKLIGARFPNGRIVEEAADRGGLVFSAQDSARVAKSPSMDALKKKYLKSVVMI